jgi:hypothetical protein
MTHIEQAIKEAVDKGGFEARKLDYLLSYSALKGTGTEYIAMKNTVLLDPFFWQALGKARGWSELKMPNRSPIGQYEEGSWFSHWHRFIDHLAEGKDAESFFKDL